MDIARLLGGIAAIKGVDADEIERLLDIVSTACATSLRSPAPGGLLGYSVCHLACGGANPDAAAST